MKSQTNELLSHIFKCLYHHAHSVSPLFISTTPSNQTLILKARVFLPCTPYPPQPPNPFPIPVTPWSPDSYLLSTVSVTTLLSAHLSNFKR